jgi:acyl carrier protein
MANRSSILDAVHVAIRNTNEALPIDKKIGLSESERIIGTGAKIDSLAFVTLMVAVEKEVESAVGSCPSLVEELSDSSADVATLGQLIDYISERA